MKASINYIIIFALFAMLLGYVNCLSGDNDDPDPEDASIFTIGGTITDRDGAIRLSLNGIQETFSTDNFTFSNVVEQDDPYLAQFVSSSTDQVCTVTNGLGIAGANVTDVEVTCVSAELTQNMYQITYTLPDSKHSKSKLLKMDDQQAELYHLIQKNF